MGSRLDLVIVGIFLVILVGIGFVFGKLVKTGKDYFRAGTSGSWWLVGTSGFMAGISSYTFVGIAAAIYNAGWSILAIYIGGAAGFVLGAMFLAAWYRQMRVITFAEIIRERFGKVAEQFVAHLLVLNGYMWSGVVLYSLATFTQILLPELPVQAVILSVGAVILIYCTIGGNWAVMANDFVQGLIMVIATTMVTFLCLREAGGVGGFVAAFQSSEAADSLRFISSTTGSWSDWGSKYGLTWMLMGFALQFTSQLSLVQGTRYFSAKDGREAKRASLLAGILMILGLATFFIPPIYARLFLADQVMAMHEIPQKAAEFSYAVTCFTLLPAGTFSIIILSIFSAAISSLDVGMNANAALIIRDLLPPIRRLLKIPPMPERREVLYGKVATFLSGLVVVGIALIYSVVPNSNIFDLMMQLASRVSLPLTIPLVLFLFVRRAPGWCIWSSLAGGFLPSLIDGIRGTVSPYQVTTLLAIAGGCAGYFVSLPFWNRVSKERKKEIAAFYERMHRPIDFAKEIGKGNDAFQLIQIGRFAMLVSILFLFLLFIVKGHDGHGVVLTVSGFTGGIGALMLRAGKRIAKKDARADH